MSPLLRKRLPVYATAAGLAAVLSFWPTPYSLILPGRAIDLRGVVSIAHHQPAPSHFYLTDVRLATHATPVELLRGLMPGARIVRTNDVVPRGISVAEYEGIEREAMDESQAIAAAVAERAAGYPVPSPRSHVLVISFTGNSKARGILHPMDMLLAIDGHAVDSRADVVQELSAVKQGGFVTIAFMHRGRQRVARVATTAYAKRAVLGVYLTTILERPSLPVPVGYRLDGVAGSSGGLMFALQVYCTFKHLPCASSQRIAGTGTIAFNGMVGPIEGARQKVVAAREAGASVFLVPVENYRDVAGTSGIRIVPVANFDQALKTIAG